MSGIVTVLMTSYNGEKYIEEQLKSLFAQTYGNIRIVVRDDGSSDSTPQILKRYEAEGKLTYYAGENIGFAASFFDLLARSGKSDYWAFCDQDDIWYPGKVEAAVEWLDAQEDTEPCMYYSMCEMIDEQGKSLGLLTPPKNGQSFRRMMTGTFGVGFSMVINAALREEMLKCDPEKVHSHDWLIGAIAVGMGKFTIDERIMAKYRRLDESVTISTFEKRVKWLKSSMTESSDVKDRNIEFSKRFKDRLSTADRKTLSLFDSERYDFISSIKKAFYPRRWRPTLSSELAMRFLMLMGRV